ncbi:MAG: WD40 repeat domain-containing protein [Chloroflexi bacterium]|nr:WD40 repeat domain-containing protein [Chloroflexota bacterium]
MRTHLDGVMGKLSENEKEICSAFFDRLVTPSGTKIAQTSDDLVAYTARKEERVLPVLKSLADARVLRTVAPPPDRPTATRYEIFHDVLAPAILDWRRRYVEKQERAREQQRLRRLRFAFLGAAVLLIVFAALAFFALQQRGIADEQRAQAITQRDVAATAQANAVQAQATAEANQKLATSRELAASALSAQNADSHQLGVLLAIEANRASHTYESEDALRRTLVGLDLLQTLRGHTYDVISAVFSPDGKQIVTASHDNTARVWDVASGRELFALRAHTSTVYSVVFSPDGKQIVTASDDNTARVWDASSGRELSVLRGHTDSVFRAVFSPDGKQIVTAGQDNTARVWDVASGREHFVLRGHTDYVFSALFSPDGKLIATASGDNTARVWDATTGRELSVLRGHTDRVLTAVFSPDGKLIVTAGEDSTARVYLTRIEDLIELARTRVTRELTCAERQQYLHENIVCPTPTPTLTPTPVR